MNKRLLILGVAAALQAAGAQAQQGEIEEIVVTAQKKTELLQDVPISVSVLSGGTLDKLNLSSLLTISRYTPNFEVKKSGGNNFMAIRGFGSGSNGGFEQSVGMYSDGIFLGRSIQFSGGVFDVDRVEVLRGPQSVLFGKNSTAGAVSLVSTRPGKSFDGYVGVDWETQYNEQKYSAVVNVPLADNFATRIAIRDTEANDGYLDNSLSGHSDPQRDEQFARVSAVWDATDALNIFAKYEYDKIENKGSQFQVVDFGSYGAVFQSFDPAAEDKVDLHSSSGGFYDEHYDVRSDLAALIATYSLGDYTLTSTTGYTDYELDKSDDSDFGPAPLLGFLGGETQDQFSQELRLESPASERFEYLAGLYYQTNSLDWSATYDLNGAILRYPNTTNVIRFQQDSDIWALFAQGTYHFSPEFRLVVGARYSDETKTADKSVSIMKFQTTTPETSPAIIGFNRAIGTVPFTYKNEEINDTETSPALTVQYDIDAATMLYAKASQGYKSGGFDTEDKNGTSIQYKPEQATAYELGAKTSFANRRGDVAVALYYEEFEDLQVSAFNGTGFTVSNAAKAHSQGFEVDGRYSILDNLWLTGSLAYLDATYDDYRNAACTAAQSAAWTGPPGSRCVQDLSGRTPAHAPEWTAFAGVNHDLAFKNGMHLRSLLVGTYADDQHISSDLNEVLQQDGYFLLDLGVTLFGMNDKWDVGILGKNITDERAMSYGAAVSFFTGAYAATIIEPLTVTLAAHYRF